MGRLVALPLVALAAAVVAGCGGEDRAEHPLPPNDPVAIAIWIREGSVICDIEHARRADDFSAGWTAYAPGTYDPGPERRARARVEYCRENVPPGTTVTARLESRTRDRAVVLVRTISPSGGGRAERMRFVRFEGGWLLSG
jgi:hypothetical protein